MRARQSTIVMVLPALKARTPLRRADLRQRMQPMRMETPGRKADRRQRMRPMRKGGSETENAADADGGTAQEGGSETENAADADGDSWQEYDAEGMEYSTDGMEYSASDYNVSMDAANEVYYVYDPVTGQETTVTDESGQEIPSGNDVQYGADGTAAPGTSGNDETVSPEDPSGNSGTVPPAEEAGSYQAAATVDTETGELNFGTVSEDALDYADVQFFTVTNTGSGVLHFESISPEHFMVGDITEALEPGESVQLFIQPRTGVEPGEYRDEIIYRSDEGVALDPCLRACGRGI